MTCAATGSMAIGADEAIGTHAAICCGMTTAPSGMAEGRLAAAARGFGGCITMLPRGAAAAAAAAARGGAGAAARGGGGGMRIGEFGADAIEDRGGDSGAGIIDMLLRRGLARGSATIFAPISAMFSMRASV